MVSAEPADRGRPQLSLGPDDWPTTVADKIVDVVGTIRARTTDRAVYVIRGAVYCLVAGVAAVAVVVLLAIAAVRMADAYLPIGGGVGSATWAAHGFIGLLATIMGLGFWRARTATAKPLYVALLLDAALVIAVVFYGVVAAVA